ncbi:MAG: 3'-5' exonuclease [Bacteroidales bacterium]
MLENLDLETILFLDIETVPQYANYEEVPEPLRKFWEEKSRRFTKAEPEETPESLYRRAGIYAEFGRIVCISVGHLRGDHFRVKSFYSHDERELLEGFSDLLNRHYCNPGSLLCAHNGKEFDFPYISRRLLINGLPLPSILRLQGKKPWEVQHLDTMDLWRFGDYKNFTSLKLLAAVFGIPSPKDDIDGSMVWQVYWEEKNLERIVEYCQKDTLTIARLLQKYLGKPMVSDENVIVIDENS